MVNFEHWTLNTRVANAMAKEFNERADQTNDARDHAELHAASEVLTLVALGKFRPGSYIYQWIEGLR